MAPSVPCRVCGAPGSLYLTGRWCLVHSPHPVQPTPPPHGLVRPTAAPAEPEAADAPVRAQRTPLRPDAPARPPSARGAALAQRVAGIAEKAPRYVSDPYVRTGRSRTSAAAALKVLPKSGTQRAAVLDAIAEAYRGGYAGATDPELCRRLELSPNSERPRRGELVEMGLVEASEHTRRHEGSEHIVWTLTPAALGALRILPT